MRSRNSRKPDFKAGFYIVMFAILALVLVAAMIRHSAAQNHYSSRQQILYVSARNGTIWGPGTNTMPYKTITQAIGAAPAGSVIVVEPGQYRESLYISKSLILLGQGESSTIINASGKQNGIFILGKSADGTVVGGFTVEGSSGQGIFAEDTSNITVGYMQVQDTSLNATNKTTEQDKAIQFVGVSNSIIEDNVVQENKAGGIGISDSGSPNANQNKADFNSIAYGNRVLENYIYKNADNAGIALTSYNANGVMHNVVANNTISANPAGIVIDAAAPGSTASFNTIFSNFIRQNIVPGIILLNSNQGTLSNTSIYRNFISQNGAYPESGAVNDANPTAVLISAFSPIYNTTIVNNTITQEYYGVWSRNAAKSTMLNNSLLNVTVSSFGNFT